MPNLIEVQKSATTCFLKSGDQGHRWMAMAEGHLPMVFPIQGTSTRLDAEFVKYELEKPKYDVEECMQRDGLCRAAEGHLRPDRVCR